MSEARGRPENGPAFLRAGEKDATKSARAEKRGILTQKLRPAKASALGYAGAACQISRRGPSDPPRAAHAARATRLGARVFATDLLLAGVLGRGADRSGGVLDVGARRALGRG